jgi:hypothetical protein
MADIDIDKDKKFLEMLNSEHPSENIVNFLDLNYSYPGFKHYMAHQHVWVRDHKWYLSRCNKRDIPELEAFRSYQLDQSERFRVFYFLKYLLPVFCDTEKIARVSDEDKDWSENLISKISDIKDKYSLNGKLDLDFLLRSGIH